MPDNILRFPSAFCRRRAGKYNAAGICGYSPFRVIDHCISIAAVTSDEHCAGIVNSGYYGTTNCYFNNDVYDVKEEEEGKGTFYLATDLTRLL